MRNSILADHGPLLIVALVAAIATSPANALFVVNQPWVRPAQIAQSTEVYMNLTSTEGAKIIAVHTDVATIATMRAPGKTAVSAPSLTLPPRTLVALAPGQYRILLKELLRTLKQGDRLMLTLTIVLDDGARQDIAVDAEVRLRSPIDDERRAHAHTHSPH